MSEETGSVGLTAPGFSAQVNGIKNIQGVLIVLNFVLAAVMAVLIWQHADAAGDVGKSTVSEIQKAAEKQQQSSLKIEDAIKEQARQSKLQTCIMYLSLSEDQRRRVAFDQRDICR